MANTATELPAELHNVYSKYRVIEYLRTLAVPSRFRRKVLQDWGVLHSVEITPDDFRSAALPDLPNEGA